MLQGLTRQVRADLIARERTAGTEVDVIFLRELRAETVIGVHAWERSIRRTLLFDIELGTDIRAAAASDAVEDTINYRAVAGLWHRLMKELGYERYGVGGGDFGAGVAVLMALDDPGPVLGVHLTNMDIYPYLGPGSRPLSPAEEAYLAQQRAWDAVERGYSGIQSTRPQTVGYGLTDSPAGLAAWIGEKWRSWTGSEVSRDFLLTVLTIYWATRSITSSMRDYYDNRWSAVEIGPTDYVRVPTGLAVFSHERVPEGEPPREWAERLHNVRRWTPMPRGGHFAPVEEPDLVARDIAAFFAELLG